MSPKMKRVLYALAVGLVFALFTSITDAGTPQANLRGQFERSRSGSKTLSNGQSSIRVSRQANLNQETQKLLLQQQFLLQQTSLQPQFIVVPGKGAAVVQPAFANQFVPLHGSGQKAFSGFGFGSYGAGQQQQQRVNRISFGK